MAPKFGLGAEIQSPTGLLLLVLLLLLLLIIFFDSETGPLPTLPTLFLLFLCLFFGLLLWDFQSTKALSFYNRSSLNFAQRLKTIFSTILHNIGLHISSSSSSIGGPYRPTVPGPSMYCKSARHIYHSAHCTQLGTVPTASLTTVVHKYEKHGSFSPVILLISRFCCRCSQNPVSLRYSPRRQRWKKLWIVQCSEWYC